MIVARVRDASASVRDYPGVVRDYFFGNREPVKDSAVHLDAAMSWLCRAQDAGPDRGVARMFHVRDGWGASYPETTGYVIPTFLTYAKHFDRDEHAGRALEMAEWECAVQMPSGAVQGGVVTDAPTPAIFNTGQVLFGWSAAHKAAGSPMYRKSALAAGNYLCEQQDPDGAWRRNLSRFCGSPSEQYTYNVRSAWGLLVAGNEFDNDDFRRAAEANARFVLTRAHDNGWFEDNCLETPEQPLLHTIAYTFQGLLEIGVGLGLDDAVDTVVRGNRALLASFDSRGQLRGAYDKDWRPTVRWRCLTGEAQIAIVWLRLAAVTGEDEWRRAGVRLLAQLKATQALSGSDGIRGGIKGSHPISGPYGRLQYLNWAAKFYADALMLELGVDGASVSG